MRAESRVSLAVAAGRSWGVMSPGTQLRGKSKAHPGDLLGPTSCCQYFIKMIYWEEVQDGNIGGA